MSRPTPYTGRHSPFPLPIGKRSLGGWAALDQHAGAEGLSELFQAVGPPQTTPLGKTRCYWALLESHSTPTDPYDLTFLYCDPVLESHLNTERGMLIGKSFFDWVHPAAKERAKVDLQSIMASRTLFGSVTRCRYTRITAMRKIFGNPDPEVAPDSHMYVDDDSWLPIDVVLNMVGDFMALCFFHAIINKSARDDDEISKTDWSNWCGTGRELFDDEQCNRVWSHVNALKLYKRPSEPQPSPTYVFQILTLPPTEDEPSEILFSWPPPRLYAQDAPPGSQRDQLSFHEAFEDGSYFADEFARLAQSVRTSPSGRTEDGATARNGDPGTIQDGANTSCTRRFRAKHTLTSEGMLRSVEMVLVPYGSIMFACFGTLYQQIINHSAPQHSQSPEATCPADLPSNTGAIAATPRDVHSELPGPARKRHKEAATSSRPNSGIPGPWHSEEHPLPAVSGGGIDSLYLKASMAGVQTPVSQPQTHLSAASTAHVRPLCSTDGHSDNGSQGKSSPTKSVYSCGTDVGLSRPSSSSFVTDRLSAASTAAAALFAETHPEDGDKRCTSCWTSESPEWRRGPTGQKSLCNACGLRYSRSISRKQKKEEKAHQTVLGASSAPDSQTAAVKRQQKGPITDERPDVAHIHYPTRPQSDAEHQTRVGLDPGELRSVKGPPDEEKLSRGLEPRMTPPSEFAAALEDVTPSSENHGCLAVSDDS